MKNSPTLAEKWQSLKANNERLRIRDAAAQLGVSELQLLATTCGNTSQRLKPQFKRILPALHTLGEVMALSRNDHAVSEIHGRYEDINWHEDKAMFFAPSVDVRFEIQKWFAAYAVNENDRHSLQFFDHNGDAAHKIYITGKSDLNAYHQLVETYLDECQDPNQDIPVIKALNPEETLSIEQLAQKWLAAPDLHQSHELIKHLASHKRTHIYRALGEPYLKPLPLSAAEALLEHAAQAGIELMIVTTNHACIQNYSGTVQKLLRTGPWFNVLDPHFNLHLRTAQIAHIWRITKPCKHGECTAIDMLDEYGNAIIYITENTPAGEPESQAWRDLCDSLEHQG